MLSGGAACLYAPLLVRSMARCELTFSSCSCAILTVAGRGMVDYPTIVVLQSIGLELLVR